VSLRESIQAILRSINGASLWKIKSSCCNNPYER